MAEAALHNGNGKKAVVGPTTTTTTTTRPIAEALAEAAAKYNSNGKKAVVEPTIESEYDFCNHDEKEEEKEKENEKDEAISCAKKLLGCSSAEEQGKGWVGRNQSLHRRINRFRAFSQLPEEDNCMGPFDKFTITVGSTCLDPIIHPSVKVLYWALCSKFGAVFHSGLSPYLPRENMATLLEGFVYVAYDIQEATPDIPIKTFDWWVDTLKKIECSGLNVAFFLERAEQLRAFMCGKQGKPLNKQKHLRLRYGEISKELQDVEGQIQRLMKKKEELTLFKQGMATLLSDLFPEAEACREAFVKLAAVPCGTRPIAKAMATATVDNGNGKKAVEGHTNTAGMGKNNKEDDYKDGYDEGKSKYDDEEEETHDSNESDKDSEEDNGEDDSDEDLEEGSEEDDGEGDSDEGSEEDDGEDDSDENSEEDDSDEGSEEDGEDDSDENLEEDDSEDNSDEDSEEEDEEDDEDEDNNAKEEGRAIFRQNKRRPAGSSSAEDKREGNDDPLPTTYLQPKEADDDVGPLDTFTITVDGICLDSHIHPSVKARYWALCSSRGAILHRMGLLRFLPLGGVGLVVKSFVRLADNIREATPELPIYIFDRWIYISKSLQSIKCFDNGFLLERIQQLRSFLCGDQGMPLIKQGCLRGRLGEISQELQELKGEIKRLMLNQTQEMQDVEVRIEPLIRKMKELDTIKQDLATSLSDLLPMVHACRDAFAELAAAPW